MNRTLATSLLMALAAIAGYVFATWQQPEPVVSRAPARISAPTDRINIAPPPAPAISAADALNHRATHYQDLAGVDDVLELPTDFSQTEALYTLAGRADAAELERLIVESANIAHRYDRRAALDILFSRYAELDPLAALNYFLQIDLDIDDLVLPALFSEWAKKDPAAAIAASNQMSNVRLRKVAGDAILRVAAHNDPGTLKAVAAELVDRHDTKWIESEIIGIQANYQPVVALEEALRKSRQAGGQDAIWRVGYVWARNDPEAALAYASNITNARQRQHFVNAVTGRWMDEDPQTAMQTLLALPAGNDRDSILINAVAGFAKTFPEDAVEVARSMRSVLGQQALQSVYMTWAENDPDGALRALTADGGNAFNADALANVMSVVAGIDPEKAWQFSRSLDTTQQMTVMPTVLSQMSSRDPQRALQLALAIEQPDQRNIGLGVVMQQLSQSDPMLAAQYLDQLPDSTMANQMVSQIASMQARNDPAGAMAWASTLSGSAYNNALQGIGQSLAMTNPDLAASMMDQVRGDARATWLSNITNSYARADPQRALAFANQFKGDPGYSNAVSLAVSQLARTDPQAALQAASSLDGDSRRHATTRAVSNWAMRDPRAAAQWVQNSDPELRRETIQMVTSQWVNREPRAAERWAMSLQGSDRDVALTGLVNYRSDSLVDQVRIINAISTNQQREQMATFLYLRSKNRRGPQEANALLDQLNISNAARDRLRANGN